MGFEDIPKQEAMPSWLERIVTEAGAKYKNELQSQEIEGNELETKMIEFNEAAEELAGEKKNEWGEKLANSAPGEDEGSAEDVENQLAKGLVVIAKEKLKETV